ncbi:hypothetical protein BDR26DRAFT_1011079 [Obelidium mucronatum]|nr:hypothetical protein BDR26DRAFT_1011079 [Obelidium mucronatum]
MEVDDTDPWDDGPNDERIHFDAISDWATEVWAVGGDGFEAVDLGVENHYEYDVGSEFDDDDEDAFELRFDGFDGDEFAFDDGGDAAAWRRDIAEYVGGVLPNAGGRVEEYAEHERGEVLAEEEEELKKKTKKKPFRVLVVGSGLGGLLLAQALKKMGLAARVFSQEGDAFGAAWDDADHRLAYRITLSPATLSALRHCLPPANFRALVYHPTTQLPGSPPAVSKIPYIGRYLSAYFYGLIRPSPYTRPGVYTPTYLFPLLPPGLVASPLITHLFGKTKSSNNSSQSLSVTIRTLRAILLAGLDVITPSAFGLDASRARSDIPAFFSTYAASHSVHDAEFGLASVWNHGKAVIKVETLEHGSNEKEHGVDGAKMCIVFEDGGREVGDLVVDVREESGVGRGLDGGGMKDLLWISGLYPLGESEKNALIPQSLVSNASIIRSNAEVTLYSTPKHIILEPQANLSAPDVYSPPSRGPSRRVSYTLAPPPRQSHPLNHQTNAPPPLSPLSPHSSVPYVHPSNSPPSVSSPPTNTTPPAPAETTTTTTPPTIPPRKPARRGSAKTAQDHLLVSKKSSRDSIITTHTTGTSPMSLRNQHQHHQYQPPQQQQQQQQQRFRRRTSLLSVRSRTGSVFRYGSVTTPSVAAMAVASSLAAVEEKPTHIHWRLCFRVGLLATRTTAMFMKPGIQVPELGEELVARRGGDSVKLVAQELVRGWNEGVERVVKGSVGVSVGVDAFAGLGGGVVVVGGGGFGDLGAGGSEDGAGEFVVRIRAGPTSLKPFDAPHDTNISVLLSRIRDLSVSLEKSFVVNELGTAPQLQSQEQLSQLLSQFIDQSMQQERKETASTAMQVRSDMKVRRFGGVLGGLVVEFLKLLYRAVWL